MFPSHSILANPFGLEPRIRLVPCIVWPSVSDRACFAETRHKEKKHFQYRAVLPPLSTSIIAFWQNTSTDATVFGD